MDNAAIFIYPGQVMLKFLLSLVGMTPEILDPFIQTVGAFILSLIIWILILKFLMRLASKALGLDQQGRRP